ncbi:YwmB family TATA-box binding protein [Bacillus sp. REN16]|uniref:YwmB family TATA-box binding protein n=1 Tax=Bacillus sp. REN16 TaxID=2887296 RepID=UPI001E3FC820|nr:YwmB family TATA-box binding protein [Bacillus sp. REN16]MCC3358549.1 YwmB family TATA-box binding protein [Bacillus sp. REN16]
MKMTIALILSAGILAGFFSNNEATKGNDLEDIRLLADKNDVEIATWMALSRGKVGQANDVKDMKNQIEQFMGNHDAYSWKNVLEEENSHYVWQGQKENEHGIKESIKLKAYKSGDKYEIAITNEAEGTKLTADQINWVSETFEDSKTFYSISGVMLSKKNQLSEVAAKIIGDAQAEAVEQLHEDKFVSVSAYSKTFESELMTAKQEKINLQVGLRVNMENEIDVTIGTPIITTEY